MSDTQSRPDNDDVDRLEAEEDKREQAVVDRELTDEGLLPLPEAEPADGPAPGA